MRAFTKRLFLQVGVLCALIGCAALLPAKQKAKSAPRRTVTVEAGYVAALATGNRFLYAWQTQDEESGMVLLTDDAKEHATEEGLEAFFAPGNGVQRSYEIGRGKPVKPGRYEFPVSLFETTEATGKWTVPRRTQMILVSTGEEEWAVDKLP